MSLIAAYCSALLLLAAGSVLAGRFLPPKVRGWLLLLVVAASILLPMPQQSLLRWLAGATGELSVPSLVLLTGYILRRQTGKELLGKRVRLQLYLVVLVAGLVLYPATMGLSMVDPYRAGYGMSLNLLVSGLAVAYLLARQYLLGLVFVLVVVAAETAAFRSTNTWDYLVDPLLWFASPLLLLILLAPSSRATQAS